MKSVFKKMIPVLLVFCMLYFVACGKSNTDYTEGQFKQNTAAHPTNATISFSFINYKEFDHFLTDGVYKCGIDFPSGDYYMMSIFDHGACYDVSDTAKDFQFDEFRIFRKVSVAEGQYVKIPHGGLFVSCDKIDMENMNHYGIFLVGKDLPEGEYKIKTITDQYDFEMDNSFNGICGSYQISEGSPENDPIENSMLFENQTYITLQNGQYITIYDAELTLVD